MSTREKQAELAAKLKAWQRIENTAISQTAQVMERTENPVIRAHHGDHPAGIPTCTTEFRGC